MMAGWVWLLTPWGLHLSVATLALYPLARVFKRAGLASWPALFVYVPVLGFAIVGSCLAFPRWPLIAPRNPKKRAA
jgi:hypothetical protein